jgi:formate-dependent nitrite reductase membrane component NrfD
MLITPFDVAIVMFLSTLAGILMCEAYHLMEIYDDEQFSK